MTIQICLYKNHHHLGWDFLSILQFRFVRLLLFQLFLSVVRLMKLCRIDSSKIAVYLASRLSLIFTNSISVWDTSSKVSVSLEKTSSWLWLMSWLCISMIFVHSNMCCWVSLCNSHSGHNVFVFRKLFLKLFFTRKVRVLNLNNKFAFSGLNRGSK